MSALKRPDGHDSLTFATLQAEPRRFARGMVTSGLWLAVVLLADQACTLVSRRASESGSW